MSSKEPFRKSSLQNCFPQLPNCIEYEKQVQKAIVPSKKSEKIVSKLSYSCSKCRKGYFLMKIDEGRTVCQKGGDIRDCEIYLQGNLCQYCRNGYHLSNNLCKANSKSIKNCLYQNDKEECLVCRSQYALRGKKHSSLIHKLGQLKLFLENYFSEASPEEAEKIVQLLNDQEVQSLNIDIEKSHFTY